jgi:hypothetical protein
LKSLNKKYQQRRKDFLDKGKDKTSTIKIKCLEQTARNFTTFSDRKIPMCKMHQPKKKQRTFGKKYLEKRFNTTLDQKLVPTRFQYGKKPNI